VVNACVIWTFAWRRKTRAKLRVGRDIFASLEAHLFDQAGFFCAPCEAETLPPQRISADPTRAVLFLSRPEFRSDVLIERGVDATVKPKYVRVHESRKLIPIATTNPGTETATSFAKALVVNQTWRCVRKVARVWLNGRSVRIMAPRARLRDYQPYRAGPPNPTQSSAMISSPAAPTAGLSIPVLRQDKGRKRVPGPDL
jgi:hypothetical protein